MNEEFEKRFDAGEDPKSLRFDLDNAVVEEPETQTLNVIEPATRRVLGTIEADIFRSDKLLYGAGSHGWRAWETLTERERAEFGLEQEDPVHFERAQKTRDMDSR